SVVIFRLGQEWLALPVGVLIEVTNPRRVHRVPHRGGVLAGLVNIRGELHLCVHLDQVLGITRTREEAARMNTEAAPSSLVLSRRLLVVQSQGGEPEQPARPGWVGGPARHTDERWVFPVDEVDQVHRFPTAELTAAPAT